MQARFTRVWRGAAPRATQYASLRQLREDITRQSMPWMRTGTNSAERAALSSLAHSKGGIMATYEAHNVCIF